MDLKPGEILNGIFQVEKILEGGMGIVYVCKILDHESSDNLDNLGSSGKEDGRVAWKSFSSSRVWDGQTLKRFENEALLWTSLPPHPNIVKAITVNRAGRQYMILLEYVDGGSLRDRLLGGPLGLADIISWSCQICEGMHFLHDYAHIIHRDLKPENLLLTRDGLLKITDLGLASAVIGQDELGPETPMGNLDSKQRTAGFLGTVPYMAPEQFAGPEHTNEKSDQFSFGAILYEMITGRRPFKGHSIAEYREAIIRIPHERLPTTQAAELSGVVDRCLAKEPHARFGSFTEVRDALERVATEFGCTGRLPAHISFKQIEDEMDEQHWSGRGFALGRLNRLEESLDCYRKACELTPDRLHTKTNMAVALRRLGRNDEALPYDQSAVELARRDPKQPLAAFAFLSLAQTLYSVQRPEEALELLDEGSSLFPENLNLWKQLTAFASILGFKERRDYALTKLIGAQEGIPEYDNPRSICTDAIEFAQGGLMAEARWVLEYAVRRFPDSGECWYNLGVLSSQEGKQEQALEHYGRAIKNGYRTALVFVNRGLIFALGGRLEHALSDWKQAQRIEPGHPAVEGFRLCMSLGEGGLEFMKVLSRSTTIFDL